MSYMDRLERELVAAADRRNRRPRARRLVPDRVRGPLARVAVAAVVIAALVVAAGFALTLRAGTTQRRAPHSATAPPTAPPVACPRRPVPGRSRPKNGPIDPQLLDQLAVMRRPQTARDRGASCYLPSGVVLNPVGMRYAGKDVAGNAIYLVPYSAQEVPVRSPAHPDRRARMVLRPNPGLCFITVDAEGAGGGCSDIGHAVGQFSGSDGGGEVGTIFHGVFADDVAHVAIHLREGTTYDVPVRDNVATFRVTRQLAREAPVKRVALVAADGSVISSRAPGALGTIRRLR